MPLLNEQIAYTDALINQFAVHKHRLGELQLWAEQAKTPTPGARTADEREAEDRATMARRDARVAVLHEDLRGLTRIEGYGADTDYGAGYRKPYVATLTCMRQSLKSGDLSQPTSSPPGDRDAGGAGTKI